jgi:hypothetical protein
VLEPCSHGFVAGMESSYLVRLARIASGLDRGNRPRNPWNAAKHAVTCRSLNG